MDISLFDFELPKELIAQFPREKRDSSRMMVVERERGEIIHESFKNFPSFLRKDDLLVLNNTRVIPAKFFVMDGNGRKIEVLILRELGNGIWETLCKPSKKMKKGMKFKFIEISGEGEVLDEGEWGRRYLKFSMEKEDFYKYLRSCGYAPLPPYIKRNREKDYLRERDLEFYQTIWAKINGSIAAPTAGMHFTKEILDEISAKGVEIVEITLHVGEATFRPLKVKEIEKHKMGEEYVFIGEDSAKKIEEALKNKRRIVAVGTTVVRALESSYENGKIKRGGFFTDLFIYPPFKFNVVSSLFTNFHLPKSTLFILVSAFAGLDLMKKAYSEAIRNGYRFFSYGDCMFIV
jgi:S-adenosylmethionine:tRNA ribosyltransferase-isomerase